MLSSSLHVNSRLANSSSKLQMENQTITMGMQVHVGLDASPTMGMEAYSVLDASQASSSDTLPPRPATGVTPGVPIPGVEGVFVCESLDPFCWPLSES